MNAALWLACTYADHAIRFSRTLKHQPRLKPGAIRVERILAHLPDEFTNQDVYRIAGDLSLKVGDRQLRRDLQGAARRGLIQEGQRGCWRKL